MRYLSFPLLRWSSASLNVILCLVVLVFINILFRVTQNKLESRFHYVCPREQAPLSSVSSGVFSDSCRLSWWCCLAILSSAAPFSFCLQSFPASGSFPMSRLFAPGSQSIRAAASLFNQYLALISFRIDRFDLLVVQGTLKNLLQDHSLKASVLQRSVFFLVQLSHPYVTTGKNPSFDYTDLCWQRIGRLLSLFFFLLRGESLVHFELTFAHDVR